MTGRPSRRRVLRLSLAACLWPWAWVPALGGTARRQEAPPAARQLVAELFGDPDRARTIGRLYLASIGGRRGSEKETAELERFIDRLRPRTVARLERALRDRIRNDFATGEVVVVQGWYLARTEARICSLLVA